MLARCFYRIKWNIKVFFAERRSNDETIRVNGYFGPSRKLVDRPKGIESGLIPVRTKVYANPLNDPPFSL